LKLSSLNPELEKRQVPLYGIVHQRKGARDFTDYLKGATMLYDEKKVFYSGETKINLLSLLRFSSLYKYFAASRSGIKDNYKGDGTLLGGTIVIGGDDQGIVYEYLSKDVADEVDPQKVLKAVKSIKSDNSQ
jgi:hypothetical protein